MKKTTFPTSQDAEAAFYEALERGDLDGMMEVWAEDEEIVCVHPGGARHAGYEQVRESWAQIFRSGRRLQVQLSNQVCVQGMMLAVHSLHETILAPGEPGVRQPVVATNIYLRAASGWRMILHHGSLAPEVVQRRSESPKILH